MKKTLVLFFALFALVACNLDIADVVETQAVNETDEIKLNITITRADISPDTKATVKSVWADGDVVFLFFSKATTPNYIELKYNGSQWNSISHGINSTTLSEGGTMTAIYLPYGSGYTVVASGGKYLLWTENSNGKDYMGHFYKSEKQTFGFEDNVLSANIVLTAPEVTGGDKLVHFDISAGYNTENTYVLNQDFMKRLSLSSIAADGTVNQTVSAMGFGLPGYIDAANGIVSFSGVLDATGVGSETRDFRFVIHDKTDKIAYSRVVNNKIEGNKYIGIGGINDAAKWDKIPSPYFSVSPTRLVEFAPGNLYRDNVNKKWAFFSEQYGATFKDNTSTYNQQEIVANPTLTAEEASTRAYNTVLNSNNRDLFQWTELVTDNVIGSGQISPTTTTKIHQSIDFGTINGKSDWCLCPSFTYMLMSFRSTVNPDSPTQYYRTLAYREGSRFARAVLMTSNGFPTMSYFSGTNYVGPLNGISGCFIFPDDWDDAMLTSSMTYATSNYPEVNIYNPQYEWNAAGATGDILQSTEITQDVYDSLIAAGAVFIPCSGLGSVGGQIVRNIGNCGGMWTSSQIDGYGEGDERACYWLLFKESITENNHCNITDLRSVRLIRYLN